MVSANADLLEVTSGPYGVLSDETLVPEDHRRLFDGLDRDLRAGSKRVREARRRVLGGAGQWQSQGRRRWSTDPGGVGHREAFDEARALLDELGHGVTYVGDDEVARLVKICHNMLLGIVTQAMAEITVLAESGGIKRSDFLSFLNDSVMGSTFSKYKTPAFVNLDFKPTFTPVLLRKDFDLGMAAAKELKVPMPVSALCSEIVLSAIGAGYVDDDFAVLLLEQARSAGLVMESEHLEVNDGLSGER